MENQKTYELVDSETGENLGNYFVGNKPEQAAYKAYCYLINNGTKMDNNCVKICIRDVKNPEDLIVFNIEKH